jgi:hypothetical protein
MSFFCFLWMPLFYLFRRSITNSEGGAGGVLALLLGSVVAIFRFFFGSLVSPGGFGFSRWSSGFVDIVSLPVLVPLIVCLLFILLRLLSGTPDFVNFTLLWFIPAAALRALSWSSQNDPILLVLVPLLWTAIALGIPFFIDLISAHRHILVIIPASLAILAIPVLAATVYWAFFSQKNLLGFLLFFITLAPLIASIVRSMIKSA